MNGSMVLGVIDIVILVLLLLFIWGGIRSGFLREVFGVASVLGAGTIAYFLAALASRVLNEQFELGNLIYTFIQTPLVDAINFDLSGFSLSLFGLDAEVLAVDITNIALFTMGLATVFFIALISLLLAFAQLIKLTKQVFLVRFIDQTLGLAIGLVRFTIVVAVLMTFATLLAIELPAVESFLSADLSLGTSDFSIGKSIYNLIVDLVTPFL
jgi:uncharacterized membrane protein required for colicin V production